MRLTFPCACHYEEARDEVIWHRGHQIASPGFAMTIPCGSATKYVQGPAWLYIPPIRWVWVIIDPTTSPAMTTAATCLTGICRCLGLVLIALSRCECCADAPNATVTGMAAQKI